MINSLQYILLSDNLPCDFNIVVLSGVFFEVDAATSQIVEIIHGCLDRGQLVIRCNEMFP